MIDHLLRTAGHWSDTDVRQKLIHQAARILGVRGSETWLDAIARLRNRLHLAPGILEHQTLTESMERDRNRPAYAQARIDEINDDAREQNPTANLRPVAGPTSSGSPPSDATTRPDQNAPPSAMDLPQPARHDDSGCSDAPFRDATRHASAPEVSPRLPPCTPSAARPAAPHKRPVHDGAAERPQPQQEPGSLTVSVAERRATV